ncbi:hypothetical protein DL771_003633 [Monosporascus sp. 5C6A]|nr:hypothetical protein DL771_003633 [Monosporascus sp. 5C6A]
MMALNMDISYYLQSRGAVVSTEQGHDFAVGISLIMIIAVAMAIPFYDSNGALNIVIDLAIHTVPIPMLWRIQIATRQKIALTLIFGLGMVAVAGCVRFSYVRVLAHSDVMFFYLADSLNWCSVEIYLAIFCGSVSAYNVLLRTYPPGRPGSSRGKNSYDANHHKSRNNNRPCQGLPGGVPGKSTIVGGSGTEILDFKNRREDSGDRFPSASASGSHQHGVT